MLTKVVFLDASTCTYSDIPKSVISMRKKRKRDDDEKKISNSKTESPRSIRRRWFDRRHGQNMLLNNSSLFSIFHKQGPACFSPRPASSTSFILISHTTQCAILLFVLIQNHGPQGQGKTYLKTG